MYPVLIKYNKILRSKQWFSCYDLGKKIDSSSGLTIISKCKPNLNKYKRFGIEIEFSVI